MGAMGTPEGPISKAGAVMYTASAVVIMGAAVGSAGGAPEPGAM